MAAARVNLPSVFLYGGSILPGQHKGQATDIVSRVRGGRRLRRRHHRRRRARRHRARRLPERGQLRRDVHGQHDGVGGRGHRHVAARLVVARRRPTAAGTTSPTSRARPSCACSSSGIRPRQIMTKEAFENAIAVVMALGGSTNAVLHLLAIAAEARVELDLEDFNRVAARVPHIADTKPHGAYHMVDIDRVGGIPMVMRHLLEAGPAPRRLPHGHRQDHRREPGRPRSAGARRQGHPPAVRPDPPDRWHRRAAGARWPRRARW